MGSGMTAQAVITRGTTRRRVLGGAIAGVSMTLGLGTDVRGQATPVGTPQDEQSGSDARYLFGGSWGISGRYALWAGISVDGGTVYLLDADATSPTFGETVATTPIDLPSNAAVPGEDLEGTNTYVTAFTADSMYGFVSLNGDSLIKVFDLCGVEISRARRDATTPDPLP